MERLFQLVPAGAYKGLKVAPGSQDPRLVWVVFPMVEEGGFSKAGAEADHLGVMEVVDKLGLYQEVNEDLAELQTPEMPGWWKSDLPPE